MDIKKKSRIVFMGDSITDSNRNRQAIPAGWSSWGDGYVNLINAYTTAYLPMNELMIVNKGISGDTITDIQKRWEKDVIDFKADWVTLMIGINDVWRHFDGTFCQEPLIDLEKFECTYREIIERSLNNGIQMILLSPFMVEQNQEDPMRKMVDSYRSVVKKLADDYQLIYGDIQSEIDCFLQYQSSYVLSSDRVHISLAGHYIISQNWLNITGSYRKGEFNAID